MIKRVLISLISKYQMLLNYLLKTLLKTAVMLKSVHKPEKIKQVPAVGKL